MKYAVIESLQYAYIKPFGGCFEIDRETNSTVWLRHYHRDGFDAIRYPKSRVVCYSDKDLTDECVAWNKKINAYFVELSDLVKQAKSSVRSK